MIRPNVKGATITTPAAALMIQLLGAKIFGSIALTTDQLKHIQKLYGFVPEKSNKKPEPPEAPKREDFRMTYEYEDAVRGYERILLQLESWKDPKTLMQAGADRNSIRKATIDGLRIMAWLAEFIPAGEDPLKHVIQFAAQVGLDVDCEDLSWSDSIEELDK